MVGMSCGLVNFVAMGFLLVLLGGVSVLGGKNVLLGPPERSGVLAA
jgi:hypothetical protein